MSDSALRWLLSMGDGLSAPASSAEKKLELLEKRMHTLRKAADETTDKALAKRLGSKLGGLQVEKIEALGMAAADQHAGHFVETLDHGLHLVGMMGEAALKVGETIAGWTEHAIGLAGGREREFISFKSMLGGDGDKARRLMEGIEKVSDRTVISEKQATDIGRRMLATGGEFTARNIPTYLKALGDAAAATGNTEGVEKTANAMMKISREGKLTEKNLKGLWAAGVPVDAFFQTLAKNMGVSGQAIHALIKGGGVNANEGLFAAVAAIRSGRSGGVLGSAGAAGVQESSDRLIDKIKEKWERNFSKIWDTQGFSKWKGALSNVDAALDTTSESGKRLQESIGGAFSNLLEGVFGPLNGPDGMKGVEDTIRSVSNTIDRMGIASKGFGAGLSESLNPVLGSLGLLDKGLMDPARAKELEGNWKEIGRTIGSAVEGFTSFLSVAKDVAGVIGFIVKWSPIGLLMQAAGPGGKMAGTAYEKLRQTFSSESADWDERARGRDLSLKDRTKLAGSRVIGIEAAPVPGVTGASIGGEQSYSSNATVHQVIHVGAGADAHAVGAAAKAGAQDGVGIANSEHKAIVTGALGKPRKTT